LGEEAWLAPLQDSLARKATQADDLLAAYSGNWAGDLSRVYGAASL
jgi:glutamate--cysteine ligase